MGNRFLSALRWLSLIVCTAAFVAGLLLALPWKCLVFLAIFPITGFFVPRKKQKYIWLILMLLLIAVYIWIHLPESNTSTWRAYRFEVSDPPEVLSSSLNAAVQYQAIFEQFGDSIFEYPIANEQEDLLTFHAPWRSFSHPLLSEWLAKHQDGIDRIIEAAFMDFCRFEKPADLRKFQQQKARIKYMKTWSNILIRSANEDLGSGRNIEAIEKMLAVLGMARHHYAQENLLDQAVGFALESRAIRALHRFIIEHAEEQTTMQMILDWYAQIEPNWPQVWSPILQLEETRIKNLVGMFYQLNEAGRTRISRNLGQGLHEALDYPEYRFLAYNRVSRLMAVCLWLAIPSNPEAAEDLVKQRFNYYSKRVEKGEHVQKEGARGIWREGLNLRSVVDWLIRQQVGYYSALKLQALEHKSLYRATRILIEIKQYRFHTGRWPLLLDELVGPEPAGLYFDPVSELPFVYRLSGEGFLLYSVGANRQDDNGFYDLLRNQDDVVIWPPARTERLTSESDVLDQVIP